MQSRGVIDGESIGTIIITFNVYAIFLGIKKTRSVTGFTSFAITYKNGKISDSHEYMPFYLLLQYFAMKMPPFVLNVFPPPTIKLHHPADEKCVSLQPSDQ